MSSKYITNYLFHNSFGRTYEAVGTLYLYDNEAISTSRDADCCGSTIERVLTEQLACCVEEVESIIASLGRVIDCNEEQTVLSLEEADALVL